jgi:hypothetical protein
MRAWRRRVRGCQQPEHTLSLALGVLIGFPQALQDRDGCPWVLLNLAIGCRHTLPDELGSPAGLVVVKGKIGPEVGDLSAQRVRDPSSLLNSRGAATVNPKAQH